MTNDERELRRDRRQVFIPAPDASPSAEAAKGAPTTPRSKPSDRPASAAPAPPKRAGSGRRRWPRIAIGVVVVLLIVVVSGFLWASWKFDQIERVEVSSVLGGGSGTNYLFVGSDTRDGIDADDPNAGAFIGGGFTADGPERSDTILILRLDGDGASMLSIPRDLLVTIADTGERTRINAAYNGGPARLIKTIRDNLGIPIHRYVEVDFVSFGGLVDAVGGITIDFPNPARDPKTGLLVTTSGPVELDGTQALAFVRSRNYIETIDGVDRTDPTGDLGRVQRQQQFLAALMNEVGGTRNPFELVSITNTLVGGLRIDDAMSMWDALGLLRRMRGLDPAPETLPTTFARTSSGASVLELVTAEAEPVLARFR